MKLHDLEQRVKHLRSCVATQGGCYRSIRTLESSSSASRCTTGRENQAHAPAVLRIIS